ncbi:MAG: serine/threonine protein kinase, partial [Methylomonas sp.]
QLQGRDYRCSSCRLEMAHLDYAPNGSIRGVFGWLRGVGDVVIDRYQIKSVLGKGGFGAAYLVDDLLLNGKHRALKEVPVQMFDEYETALLSRLDHPAIPDIIERRTVGGMVYLVLKFGGSRTLGGERKQYPDRRIPKHKLFPWMRQLCEVLIYLHEQDPPIIHRDLKPDNILLNENDRIMLIDFGIAKEAVADGRTRTLAMAVTVGFSPPEQIMGTGTDARADVYALGATFYALLTGKNPTGADQRIAGMELIPPSQLVSDVPPAVEEAIIKSLSLNMNHRQQSVQEFAMALSGIEQLATFPSNSGSEPTGVARPPERPAQSAAKGMQPSRSQLSLILALTGITIFMAALATAIYYYFARPPEAVDTTQPATVTGEVRPSQPFTPPIQEPVAPHPAPVETPMPANPPVQQAEPQAAIVPAKISPADENKSSSQETPQKSAVEPQTVTPQIPAPPKPRPKSKPKPAASAEPSAIPPVKSPEPAWVIIPGGAHKTD